MKVLIAEDDRVSRRVLEKYLNKWGYDVACAEDGYQAWRTLESDERFHIAVVDWNMPGLSGIELCKKIRASTALNHLYLLLLSGRGDTKDLAAGLESGADDYVVKPFDPLELSSRLKVGVRLVKSGLLLKQKNQELNKYAKEMESIADERSKMLIHADRFASLGTLTAGVAHELNNPNTFIAGNVGTLERIWPTIEQALKEARDRNPDNERKLRMALEDYPKTVEGIRNGVSRINSIVQGLKTFARVGKNTIEELDLNDCVEQALLLCANRLKYHVTVEKRLHAQLPTIDGDLQKLEQVFVNLFVNAADAMEEMAGDGMGLLMIATHYKDDRVVLEIKDTGPGIPSDRINDIWKPFFTTKAEGKGTGLGLAISQGIINDHGGTMVARNRPEGGVAFTITFPISSRVAQAAP